MDGIEINLAGFDELQRKLNDLPARAAKNALRAGLAAGAFIFQGEIEARAPRQTGFLEAHIGTRVTVRTEGLTGIASIGAERTDYPNKGGGYRRKLNSRGKTHDVGRIAASRVEALLEFGTSKMAARPFVRPAFDARKQDVIEEFAIETRAAIEREGMKLV